MRVYQSVSKIPNIQVNILLTMTGLFRKRVIVSTQELSLKVVILSLR